ncbi:MAG: hypothetical protein ACLR43_12165 [Faecalibacillus faecis]
MASITNRKGKYYVVYWFDSFDGKRNKNGSNVKTMKKQSLKRRRLKMK